MSECRTGALSLVWITESGQTAVGVIVDLVELTQSFSLLKRG